MFLDMSYETLRTHHEDSVFAFYNIGTTISDLLNLPTSPFSFHFIESLLLHTTLHYYFNKLVVVIKNHRNSPVKNCGWPSYF